MQFQGLAEGDDTGQRFMIGSVYCILGDHPSQAEFASTPIVHVCVCVCCACALRVHECVRVCVVHCVHACVHVCMLLNQWWLIPLAGVVSTGWCSCRYCHKPSALFHITDWSGHYKHTQLSKPSQRGNFNLVYS
jgi:hypothetical protein